MFTEVPRQNQDAIMHGFQRGAQHVGEQMNLEQHRRAMVQEIGAGMQPFLTENQQLIRAQNEMIRGMDAHAAVLRADLAGISREHVAAAGRMDTSLAAFTDLIQNAGAQIAQTGANTNDLIGALAHHLGQQQAGRDEHLIQALQRLDVVQDNRQVHVDARTVHVDARAVAVDARTANVDARTVAVDARTAMVDARQASQMNVLAQDNRRLRQNERA